jgi:hypothetical protein
MNDYALAQVVNAAAAALAHGRTADDLSLLGAVFTQLGDTLSLMGIQRARQAAKAQSSEQSAANIVNKPENQSDLSVF